MLQPLSESFPSGTGFLSGVCRAEAALFVAVSANKVVKVPGKISSACFVLKVLIPSPLLSLSWEYFLWFVQMHADSLYRIEMPRTNAVPMPSPVSLKSASHELRREVWDCSLFGKCST